MVRFYENIERKIGKKYQWDGNSSKTHKNIRDNSKKNNKTNSNPYIKFFVSKKKKYVSYNWWYPIIITYVLIRNMKFQSVN